IQVGAGPGGSSGDVTAAGTVTGGRGVLTQVTPGTPAQQAASATPGLSVAGVVKAGNLSATNIDVDSFVY
ncbi:hypothetical protein, partial [Escherichia coli]|uniref:hypothetical protein n=1 Tax=Escherichia coli TaxID=562 RepID=UPI001954E993